jgi:hypothetical protein
MYVHGDDCRNSKSLVWQRIDSQMVSPRKQFLQR